MDSLGILCIYRFRKRLQALTGQAPARYRALRRAAWAGELVNARKRSLAEIATVCGYHDVFHFSKRFQPLDQQRARTRAGRCASGADAGQAAAGHQDVAVFSAAGATTAIYAAITSP
jgi:hypothetical protein